MWLESFKALNLLEVLDQGPSVGDSGSKRWDCSEGFVCVGFLGWLVMAVAIRTCRTSLEWYVERSSVDGRECFGSNAKTVYSFGRERFI